jgi:type IV pilus assembly protein PilY1
MLICRLSNFIAKHTRVVSCAPVALVCIAGMQSFAAPTADLKDSPILASGRGPSSNLVMSLSVEWPTVGAAYKSPTTYDNALRTLGYWDADSCYTYITAGVPAALAAGSPAAGAPAGFFRRTGAATNFKCAGNYSGNFLNWAAQSAVDSLRYALTGGDRIVDTTTQTVLQRADLPTNFYNQGGQSYPSKRLDDAASYTPFAGTIFVANCRYVMYIGTEATGACNAPGNNGNRATLRAAVEVCSATEGPLRPDLCKLQKSGNYKPTGLMQQYSDSIRFSAFGYALDTGNQRYGGVLRAPMKYAGPVAYDAAFNKIVNPAPEWNDITGVFAVNPEASATGNSGVANYLNKFGRITFSATPVIGTNALTQLPAGTSYKGNDPVSELYYEAIRYVQGQQPTPQAVANLTANMYDGFPIYSNWTDPITSACQATSIIQIADAYTHNDKSIPGNTRTNGSNDWARGAGANEPNAVTWTDKLGVLEGFTNGASSLGQAPGGCCDASYYISGLAYWANTQPMRADKPKIRAKTFVVNVDENGNGTVRDRERRQQLYLAAKYGGFSDLNADASPFTIPPGGAPATTKWAQGVDDDGQPLPKTFFLASNPKKMIDALRGAFASIAKSTGTLAGGSLGGARITSAGTDAFTTRLDVENDAANVLAFTVTVDAADIVTVGSAPRWNAKDNVPSPNARKIYTTTNDGTPIPFLWPDLDATQKTLYNKEPYSGAVDNLGQKRVDYLRGDTTEQVSNGSVGNPKPFRDRTSLIASIVNSAPTYVGAKPSKTVSGAGYEAYYTNTTRTPAVYVGTNGGMLHSFSALDGKELFAFVPKPFVNTLARATSPNFAKQPMVDAPPVVGDAEYSAGNWKSILLSGYGGGAQGIFALDVTKPENFSTSSVLWHFSDADDSKMGNLTSAPKLLKFKTGANSYKWFAVVPSGYNNNAVDSVSPPNPVTYDPGNTRSLFLLSLNKPATDTWTLGTNYYRIDLPNTSTFSDPTAITALSSPGVEVGLLGEVVRLYAGDTLGNLWKFDFTLVGNPFASNNSLQGVISFGGGTSGKPLFTAMQGTDRQPITMEPTVGSAPGRTTLVVFGTGKFVEGADTQAANFKQQSLYGIWDDTTNAGDSRTTGRSQLASRTASGTGANFSVTGAEFSFGYNIGGGTTADKKKGWYFDFPGTANGERLVTNLAVASSSVFFNTTATVTPSANACAAYGGRQCAVNGSTGLSNGTTCEANDQGFLPAPFVLETEQYTQSPSSGQGDAIRIPKPVVLTFVGSPNEGGIGATSAGKPSVTRVTGPRERTGRLNWREIVDFDKMKKAVTP